MLSWFTNDSNTNNNNANATLANFSFPSKPQVTTLEEPQTSSSPIIVDGIKLFSYKDILAIRDEISNEQDYEILYEEPENYRKMFIKKKGEGSTGEIKRHKYSRTNFPSSPKEMFVAIRDFERRKMWDDRLEDRNVLRVFKYIDKETGCVVINSIERTAHKGAFPVQGRDFISITGVVVLNEFHYITRSQALEFSLLPYATNQLDNNDSTKQQSPPPSLPHETYGPSDGYNGYIRGCNKYFGNECFGNETTTTYTTVLETDVRGWVPSTVYNWFVKFIPANGEVNLGKGLEWRRKNSISNELNEFYYNIDSPLFK